jgi:hypothetical protein
MAMMVELKTGLTRAALIAEGEGLPIIAAALPSNCGDDEAEASAVAATAIKQTSANDRAGFLFSLIMSASNRRQKE